MPAVNLPWGAWHGDIVQQLLLPDHWSVDVLEPLRSSVCDETAISQALDNPVDSQLIAQLAAGRSQACIVVDDLARPTRVAEILPTMLACLQAGGIDRQRITILVATGSHGPPPPHLLSAKIGADVLHNYRVECHNCREDLAPTGIAYGDRELAVHKAFHQADLKLAVGCVLPHPFAGYSGGAKLIIPGIADLHSVSRSHKFVQMGLLGGGDLGHNRFRSEAEDLARRLGLEFIVCVVADGHRNTVAVVAGDLTTAHRRACDIAQGVYRTEVRRKYDLVIVNAYPKDGDLVQSEGALLPLKTSIHSMLREDGLVVLTTAASTGLGQHGLFDPDGINYLQPRKKPQLANRDLWLFVPTLSTDDVHRLFWSEYKVFQDSESLQDALAERFPDLTVAAVLPYAPTQQLHSTNDISATSSLREQKAPS